MARVAIKAGIFNLVITIPLKAPKAVPRASPARMPKNIPPFCITPAPTAPEKAKTEPTERSMPAPIITKDIPTARKATIEVCLITISILDMVKNLSDKIEKAVINPIKPINIPYCRIMSLNCKFFILRYLFSGSKFQNIFFC
ncbi:hypothetical protein ES705_45611 [subsurface metagenome]